MAFTRIRCTGSGAFPIDMLRFLQAWPATQSDAVRITESQYDGLGDKPQAPEPIVIETDVEFATDQALRRFESFGWKGERIPSGWDRIEGGPEA